MRHIFVDFEMHPISKEYTEEKINCQNEIIEFGAVMLDEEYNEISSFKKYVKPQYVREICERIVVLTGITAPMLSGAEHFCDAFQEFMLWCDSADDDYIVYAWSESDLEQLTKEMRLKKLIQNERVKRLLDNWVDFQKEYTELVESKHKLSLLKALDAVGQIYMGNVHDALCDARNTAQLFVISRNTDELFKRLKAVHSTIGDARRGISTFSLGEIFNFDACGYALA